MPISSLEDYWGAGAPYGPSGYPDNLPNMAYGPPGGGLMSLPGATPGAPSMGYPAMSQAAAGPAPGLSLSSNPITRLLAAINPIGSAQADVLHPNLSHPNLTNPLGPSAPAAPASPSRALPPGAANSLPLAWGNVTDEDYQNWLKMQLGSMQASPPAAPTTAKPSGVGSDANFPVMGAGGFPTTYGAPGQQPPSPTPTTSVATAPRGVKRTDAAYGPYDAPGAGAPQGHPSQTPRPAASSSSDRWLIDRVNAGPMAQPRRGYQTALDLSQFFKRA